MLSSVLSFTVQTLSDLRLRTFTDGVRCVQPEMAATVTEYCTSVSNDASKEMKEVWDWTCDNFDDADKMSSPLQGATMKFLAEWQQPKRSMLDHHV